MKTAAAIKLVRTISASNASSSANLLNAYGIECRRVGSVKSARLLAIAKQAHNLFKNGYTEDFMASVDGRRMVVSASNEAGARRVCQMAM